MSVRRRTQKRPSGRLSRRWIVDVQFRHPDGRIERIRRTPRVQSRVGAQRLEREILARLEGHPDLGPDAPRPLETPRQAATPTLLAFWERFLTVHVVVNNKPSEQATKRRIMALHLLPHFGHVQLSEIRSASIEAYKADMIKAGYSAKSINNHLAVLRAILTTAYRWEVIDTLPRIIQLRCRPPQARYLSFAEARRLQAQASGMWKTMITLALNTGMRIGELIALRWQDVDLAAGKLQVCQNIWLGEIGTPKSGKNREIPLNGLACEALGRLSSQETGIVFPRSAGGFLTYRQCNHALESISRAAGLESVQWHVLRHTFASHLVSRGVGLKAVQDLLGHSTQAMTERYAHLSPSARRDAVEVLVKFEQ